MTTYSSLAQFAGLYERLEPRLQALYGSRGAECWSAIQHLLARYGTLRRQASSSLWDQRDTVLITYADQVCAMGENPLASLHRFLSDMELDRNFSIVHLLPFYPSTSDDGFSVSDYRQVDSGLGTWQDITALGERFDLMFDLVLNHASAKSQWFEKYLQGVMPYTRYFVEGNPDDDLSQVVRPRTTPLLTPYPTSRGNRHLWTTFSPDQVDLNYSEPQVLIEILEVLLEYIRCGARIIRLDAVAFLWKVPGTTSLHLPQTHEIVRLIRDVVDTLAPGTLLLTETNVPQAENVSYWGNSDEAHLVYNFSLPPLLLDAFLSGDGTYLNRWLAESLPSPPGTAYLNFTASHDGIGVRALESLVPTDRIENMISAIQERGGLISRRVGADKREVPYELNITYFDALGEPRSPANEELQLQRFMASQALMLSLRGIPAIYFQSLLGTPNNMEGVRSTGRARTINRKKFELRELQQWISTDTPRRQVWNKFRHLLQTRRNQPAFHPDGEQQWLACDNPATVCFVRTSPISGDSILVAINLSGRPQTISLRPFLLRAAGKEVLSGMNCQDSRDELPMRPYQVFWLPVRRLPKVARRSSPQSYEVGSGSKSNKRC